MANLNGDTGWSLSVRDPMYGNLGYISNYNHALSYGGWATTGSLSEIISSPKVIKQPAYGLRHDEISIKEIDGVIIIKSTPVDKNKYCASINKSYTLKNVVFKSSSLALGVLYVEFVDSENVVIHKVNEAND